MSTINENEQPKAVESQAPETEQKKEEPVKLADVLREAAQDGDVKEKSSSKKKNSKKQLPSQGQAILKLGFNNTHITITGLNGDVYDRISGGAVQKGSRKGTPHAAEEIAKIIAARVKDRGLKSIHVIIRGMANTRDRTILALGQFLDVLSISDKTGVPHNGCRLRKPKRI